MRYEFRHQLAYTYPELFLHGAAASACEDGWEATILELCMHLGRLVVEDPVKDAYVLGINKIEGLLVVSMSRYPEKAKNLIEHYSEVSSWVCEICGREGKIISNVVAGPLVRCDAHKDIA
jgi:hypothetical protein